MPHQPDNPFSTGPYYGKSYFCGRKQETDTLIQRLQSGNSITIVSLRRMGKTALLHYLEERLPTTYKMAYIDILETEDMPAFLNTLSTELLQQFPRRSSLGKYIWDFISSLRPVFSFDSLSGQPQVSFDNSQHNAEQNIDAILNFLEQQRYHIIIAIDEFQQIVSYPQKNVDAWLRSRVQKLKNIRFIFSGSLQHLMTELFAHPERPFYRSTQIMHLQRIERRTYQQFIVRLFKKGAKKIDTDTAGSIYDWCDGHTFYVQQLCNRLYANTPKGHTATDWQQYAAQLLKDNELLFFSFRNMLSKHQWKLLTAIGAEDKVYHPTANTFIRNYSLGSSASVLKSMHVLINHGLIYKSYQEEDNMFYCLTDLYLRRWCNHRRHTLMQP